MCDQKFNHANEQKTLLKVKNDATHAIQLKLNERGTKSKFEVIVASYGPTRNHDDEIKKQSMTSLDVQFKEFSWNKQKLYLERTMSELGKPFPKK